MTTAEKDPGACEFCKGTGKALLPEDIADASSAACKWCAGTGRTYVFLPPTGGEPPNPRPTNGRQT